MWSFVFSSLSYHCEVKLFCLLISWLNTCSLVLSVQTDEKSDVLLCFSFGVIHVNTDLLQTDKCFTDWPVLVTSSCIISTVWTQVGKSGHAALSWMSCVDSVLSGVTQQKKQLIRCVIISQTVTGTLISWIEMNTQTLGRKEVFWIILQEDRYRPTGVVCFTSFSLSYDMSHKATYHSYRLGDLASLGQVLPSFSGNLGLVVLPRVWLTAWTNQA